MTVFADSSALVKRYSDEADHELIRRIADPIAASALARVEVPSALWRKHRIGELTSDEAAILVADFEHDWFGDEGREPAFVGVRVTPTILDDAALHVARQGLRAFDAVQLATALAVRDADPSAGSFAAFDAELRRAAVDEGLTVVPEVVEPG